MDYFELRKRFYSAEGEMMATSINYEGLPPVAPEFDAAALRANSLDSQRNGQPFREFRWQARCRGIAPSCAASASLTGATPATSTRNGSPGPSRTGHLGRPRPIEFYCAAVCDG